MKILVVTSSYPRFEGDIAGRFVQEWVERLRAVGHDLRVLTWSDSSIGAAHSGAAEQRDVVRVRYAPPGFDTLFYGAGTPENIREKPARALLAAPAAAAMLARIGLEIARRRPDIIVGHWLIPAGLLARIAGRAARIPTLIVGHSGGVHLLDQLPKPIGRTLAKICADGPMTLPSTALAHKFSALVSDEFTPTILPMGFEPPIEARRPRASRNDWLCMGRLVEIKGIDLAIRSFGTADLADATTLHIAGDGPERAALEKLARESLGAGTNRRIEFHGIVAGRAKARLLERCGFALFCSKTLADGRHEGLPVSFLEACARGLIPLSAPIPGLTDYLADPTRQSLQTRRVDAWADAITRLARISPADRLELRAAQKSRVDPLAWPELIARWDALIREIAS